MARSGLLISMLGKLNWFLLRGLIALVPLMCLSEGSVQEEKPSFKMLGLTFCSKLCWSSYVASVAKTASKKIGASVCSMKFLFPEVALYPSE